MPLVLASFQFCHCGLDPQSMNPIPAEERKGTWIPDRVRDDSQEAKPTVLRPDV